MADAVEHQVYRFFDEDGVLLYVGMTKDFQVRMRQHRDEKPWYGDVAEIHTKRYPDRESARAAEADAIQGEGPKYNLNGFGLNAFGRFRIPRDIWEEFGRQAADAGAQRSKLVNQFMAWYIGSTDEEPQRPPAA